MITATIYSRYNPEEKKSIYGLFLHDQNKFMPMEFGSNLLECVQVYEAINNQKIFIEDLLNLRIG